MNDQNVPRKSLDFYDLLQDDSNDLLSDYLRVSISNDGQNAHVSVSTVDEQPVVYSAVFYGSKATDLSEILAEHDFLAHDHEG
jgi:hypothetical protein